MALYDYRCPNGHVKEVRHPINESPVIICAPPCFHEMERVITQVSFRLDGDGYYTSDNKLPA